MGDSLRAGASPRCSFHCFGMGPRRLRRLPRAEVRGIDVPVARGLLVRLLGLAFLRRERAGPGLLIPGCRSVHTFGMRFALDLVFLDQGCRPLREVHRVPPFRIIWCRRAATVLEVPSRVYTHPSRVGVSDSEEGKEMR